MSCIDILHVDDEPDFLDLVAEMLAREADTFNITTAVSAAEGLEKLATTDIDCIVSDYQMPEQDGIEFLKAVRENHPELPFILFTGEGTEEVASAAIAAGATDYLQKGHGAEQYELLANRIQNAVNQYRDSQRATELERIRTLATNIDRTLIRADSISEIKTRVCEIISNSAPYLFAWIGEYNSETGHIEPQVWAGIGEEYLSNIVITADESPTGKGPAGTAIRNRRVAVSQNIKEDPGFEMWRQEALDHGYQSVAAVPLEYDDTLYGLLAVYSERTFAFDEEERDLLRELGNNIAHATHSLKIKNDLHKEQTLAKQTFDTLTDLFYFLDPDGNIQRCNEQFSTLTGYSSEQIKNMNAVEFFPEDEREAITEAIEETLATGHGTVEADFLAENNKRIPHEFTGDRLTDLEGNVMGLVGIGRDISERKRREQELQDQKEQLEQFATTISHDLRNPLNVIQGRLDLVQNECTSPHLDVIETATDRMERIVADLLWLAQEQKEIGSKEPVLIQTAAEAAWDLAADPVDEAELYYDCTDDTTINADFDQLQHLLENLFRNAIDHAGLDVTVSLGVFDDTDGFYIEDDGPGIPAEEREKVFTAGYSTAESGTGLGLNIVQRVVEAHGWEIHITESSLSGTRFEITGIEAFE